MKEYENKKGRKNCKLNIKSLNHNFVFQIVEESENDTEVIPPFLGYAKPGHASGKLLYANYGREEDFKVLMNNYNINCTGYIVIMRYGEIYRGDKVQYGTKGTTMQLATCNATVF